MLVVSCTMEVLLYHDKVMIKNNISSFMLIFTDHRFKSVEIQCEFTLSWCEFTGTAESHILVTLEIADHGHSVRKSIFFMYNQFNDCI